MPMRGATKSSSPQYVSVSVMRRRAYRRELNDSQSSRIHTATYLSFMGKFIQ